MSPNHANQAPEPQDTPIDRRLKELGFATWLIALVGSASVTGLLTTLIEGPAKAGLDDAVSFWSAATAGLALTVGSALAFAALNRGEFQGHAAGWVFTLCIGAGILVANAIGIGTVGMDVVQTQLASASGPPVAKGIALVAACFFVYGFIPSLQALICGGLLGHWLDLLRGPA